MIKIVAAVRRRPGMTHAEYADYIREVHGPLSIAAKPEGTPGKYLQDHVFDSAYGATGDVGYQIALPRDSVTELYLVGGPQAFGPQDPDAPNPVGEDGKNFSDMPAALSLMVAETHLEVPDPGPGAVKVLHFLKAADGIAPQAFQEGWKQAADELLADPAGPARDLRRYEWNTAVPVPPDVAAYFGSQDQPAYDAYTATWFDEDDAITGFRAYQEQITTLAEKHGARTQPSLCFFLLTREVVIFDNLTDC